MKLLKKSVAYVLSFITVFSSFTILPSEFFHSAVVSAVELLTAESNWKETYIEGDFTYSIINDDEVEIVSYNGTNTDVVIPDVTTGIECSELANKKVTGIGKNAFYGLILTSVTFGKNITEIDDYAFYQNRMLENIDLSVCTNLIAIGDYAFYENDMLITITLPDSLKSIGNRAFYNCAKLTKLKTGSKLVNIGIYAFYSCDSLSDVHISGGNNATIGYNAFYACTGLKSVTIGNGVRFINYEAFKNCTSLRELKIANTVTTVGIYAFYGCNLLETITIPDSVQSIGNYAFANNTSLKSVKIGSGCKSIGLGVFDGDNALESFTVSENNSAYSIYDGILMNKEKTRIIFFPKSKSGTYTIPNSVKAIQAETFADCTKLTGIVIGDGVTSIGNKAFSGCISLKKVTFGKKIVSIGDSAFENNDVLKELDLSSCTWLTKIGEKAFYDNDSIVSVLLPNSLQTIGISAFSDCDELTNLETGTNIISMEKEAFANCNSLKTVNIKGGNNANIGEKAFYNCNAIDSLTVGDNINSIGNNAVASCDALQAITIGSGSTTIDLTAFADNKSLKTITISSENTGCASNNGVLLNKEKTAIILVPKAFSGVYKMSNTITQINDDCFKDRKKLTGVIIGSGVQTIGSGAFSGCDKLSKITFGKNVKSIGDNAFYENQLLTTVDLSVCTNLTKIGFSAFYNNKSLETLLLPDSLERISDNAFYNCEYLTELNVKKSLTRIGDSAFAKCYRLKTVNIQSANNAVISDFAFYDCNSLVNVTANGVKIIAKRAFDGCDALTKVSLGNTITTIGTLSFQNCTNLREVTIGTGITNIDSRIFPFCNNLKKIQIFGKDLTNVNDYPTLGYGNCVIYCYENSTTHNILKSRGYSNIKFFKDIYPTAIKVNGTSLNNFNSTIRNYTVYLDDVSNVNVAPVFNSTGISYNVSVIDNVYTIDIFNANDVYSGSYTINVKNNANVYPTAIKVNGTSVKGFKSGITEYTIYVDDINNVKVEPVFENNTSTYKLTVKDNVYTVEIFNKDNTNISTYTLKLKSLSDVQITDIKANNVSVENFNAKEKEFIVYVKDIFNVDVVPVFEKIGYSYDVTDTGSVHFLDIFDENNIYICTYTINIKQDCYAVTGDIELELRWRYNGYATETIRLSAGTYKFKITRAGHIFGYNKTFTNDCNYLSLSEKYKSEITLKATGGRYEFRVDGNKLLVKQISR